MSMKSKKFSKTGNKTKPTNLAEIQPDNINTFSGIVVKCLGSCKFQINIHGKPLLTSMLPRSVAKKHRITINSIVLVEITNLSGNANSIILHCFSDDEIRMLKISKFVSAETENNEIDTGFDFETEIDDNEIENI